MAKNKSKAASKKKKNYSLAAIIFGTIVLIVSLTILIYSNTPEKELGDARTNAYEEGGCQFVGQCLGGLTCVYIDGPYGGRLETDATKRCTPTPTPIPDTRTMCKVEFPTAQGCGGKRVGDQFYDEAAKTWFRCTEGTGKTQDPNMPYATAYCGRVIVTVDSGVTPTPFISKEVAPTTIVVGPGSCKTPSHPLCVGLLPGTEVKYGVTTCLVCQNPNNDLICTLPESTLRTCGSAPTATPFPTKTPIPTKIPTMMPTKTPIPTKSPTPSPTKILLVTQKVSPLPTKTPIPTKIPTLIPSKTPIITRIIPDTTKKPTLVPTKTPIITRIIPDTTKKPTPSISVAPETAVQSVAIVPANCNTLLCGLNSGTCVNNKCIENYRVGQSPDPAPWYLPDLVSTIEDPERCMGLNRTPELNYPCCSGLTIGIVNGLLQCVQEGTYNAQCVSNGSRVVEGMPCCAGLQVDSNNYCVSRPSNVVCYSLIQVPLIGKTLEQMCVNLISR